MKSTNETTCDQVLKRLCNDLSEDIHSKLCKEILAHLEQCPDCRKNLQSLQKTVELYQCLGKAMVPEKIHNRLITLLNLENEKK